MIDETQRKATVLEYFERVNAKDLDGVVKLFATDAVVADPVGAPPVAGEEALRAYFQRVLHEFDTHDVPGVPSGAQDGQSVALPLKATINNPQDPTGGVRLDVNLVSVFTIGEDGLISEMRAYWGLTDIAPAGA
ncbi:nuclear transport factor 2 family protein [Streptomyces griseus]|uniref:Ketosteroid isomerase n=2 Tax=Streptomyces griseus TaxID=1911 RepID=B1W484_STRGG|nr:MULTISPECIES: nuclear transport factor 2 family protein [Streptomyces]MYR09082.1 ketosteroid isomerase [Streptomyces sp. SID724]MYR53732.1 ketosteroid isomerase [Streptomyces sp. SID4928]MYT80248.1 ketosteroid isomerase [Streptomyces sp. SID8364]ANZ22984.1 ZinJ [Streptomyces griseus]EGE45708.1 nuclear transport factor 2 [Streptomyces sp. ACT-1]